MSYATANGKVPLAASPDDKAVVIAVADGLGKNKSRNAVGPKVLRSVGTISVTGPVTRVTCDRHGAIVRALHATVSDSALAGPPLRFTGSTAQRRRA